MGSASGSRTLRWGGAAVKQTNTDQLEAALLNAADPDSTSYGEWLSNEAVHALVAPAQESVDAVRGFLAQRGVAVRAAVPSALSARAGVMWRRCVDRRPPAPR